MFGTSFLPLHILRPQSAPKTRILTPQNDDLRTAKGTFRHHAQTPLSSILNPTFFDLSPTFSPHFNFQAPLFQIPAPCRAPPPPPPVHVLSQLRAGQIMRSVRGIELLLKRVKLLLQLRLPMISVQDRVQRLDMKIWRQTMTRLRSAKVQET